MNEGYMSATPFEANTGFNFSANKYLHKLRHSTKIFISPLQLGLIFFKKVLLCKTSLAIHNYT